MAKAIGAQHFFAVSAKTGEGIDELRDTIVEIAKLRLLYQTNLLPQSPAASAEQLHQSCTKSQNDGCRIM